MATYKGINGTSVVNYAGDLPNAIDGQVWYDSTAADFKYQYPNVTTGSWATGANLNTTRYDGAVSMAGNKSSALFMGGYSGGIVANVESWNGSAWTETTDVPTATYAFGGTGASNTSALVFAGQTPGSPTTTATYEWGGSSWTSGGNLNSGQRYRTGAGIQTAALAAGGNGGSPSLTGETEQYNGTAWTEVADMNTARTYGSMGGGASPYTAALYIGGQNPPSGSAYTAITESWNGSSWTEVADLNTARYGLAGAGTQTSALAFGGNGGSVISNTEEWNGSSWTEVNNLNTARSGLSGAGSGTASALAAGGTPSCAVELWTGSGQPIGAWSTGGSLNVVKQNMAGAGVSQTAAISMGGEIPPSNTKTGQTELYDGTSWTEVNDMNTARAKGAGGGTPSGALTFGGSEPTVTAKTESFNGTSWTEVG